MTDVHRQPGLAVHVVGLEDVPTARQRLADHLHLTAHHHPAGATAIAEIVEAAAALDEPVELTARAGGLVLPTAVFRAFPDDVQQVVEALVDVAEQGMSTRVSLRP